MADLGTFSAAQDTAKVELYDPRTGETLTDDDSAPMWVEVYGMDSAHYRKVDRDITNRNIGRAQRARGGLALTAEQLEANELERVVKCIKDWHIQMGGETPECTEANVRKVLEQVPALREQIEAGIRDRSRFFSG